MATARTAITNFPACARPPSCMVMIGDEASSIILRELDEDEVQEISREIARVQSLTSEEAEGVLEEFYQMARRARLRGQRRHRLRAQTAGHAPSGAEPAKKMLDRLMKTLGNETLSFDALQKTDPQQLAKFIHSEHPQTIALILSHLNPSQAAGLLFSLPAEMRADVALRMASLDQISPEIISKIAAVIGSKLKVAGRAEPRILRRRARGGGNVQPPGLHHQQGNPGLHRAGESEPGGNHPPPDVRLRGSAAAGHQCDQGSAGEGGSQDSDGRAQGHQRADEESHAAGHEPARRARCCAKTWTRWGPSRSRKWRRRSSRSSRWCGSWKPKASSA